VTEVVALFSVSMASKILHRDNNSGDYYLHDKCNRHAVRSVEYAHDENIENDRSMTEMSVQ
jgi:hypothetical protein